MENEQVKTELEAELSDFCRFFAFPDIKEDIWYCVMTALAKDGSLYDEADERVRILFIYEKLASLLEIVFRREAEKALIHHIKNNEHGEDSRN